MRLDVDAVFGGRADSPFRDGRLGSTKGTREVFSELPRPLIHDLFPAHGLEFRSDDANQVQTVFLAGPSRTVVTVSGIDLRLGLTRAEVVASLGAASASGPPVHDPILGDYGPWDRFVMPGCRVHVEYALQGDGVRRMTFSRRADQPH